MQDIEREQMEFDVVIVGGGPSGLSAAIRLRQLAIAAGNPDFSVCIVEKGSEFGAHILSGAVMEPNALTELIPDWKEKGAPVRVQTKGDRVYMLKNETKYRELPEKIVPSLMHNHGNYIISLGNLVRWLATQAEELEVMMFPGFSASEILYNEDGSVRGVLTGDMGVNAEGQPKSGYEPGYELLAKYTIFAEGCRGHLGKRLISRFNLSEGKDPQHYGIGLKELWEIDPPKHQEAMVLHGSGWPLTETHSHGGWWLYFDENNQVHEFKEKPKGDGNWINAGFFVCEPKVFDYIDNDSNTVFEQAPLMNLAKDGEIFTFKHNGFWKPMDTLRDKQELQKLWDSKKAPWKTW